MFPTLTSTNQRDCAMFDAKLAGKNAAPYAALICFPDGDNLRLGQFRFMASFASWSVGRHWRSSAFDNTVSHVVPVGSQKEVLATTARAIVARVANQLV